MNATRRTSPQPGANGREGAASYRSSRTPNRRPRGRLLVPLALAATAFVPSGCQTVPVTGRRAFNLSTPAQDVELGRQAYAEVLEDAKVVTSGSELRMVERVMQRLVAVADDPGFEWEVTLIDDPATVNAFALPGGKMAVYTGILPVAGSEAGLAVVMGHEIAHVVAQHGTQRVSQSMGVEAFLQILDAGDWEPVLRGGVNLLVNLPYSRAHESEADHIGLIYMARAGYDPREAVTFWSRMAELGGGAPPEWLSTHPSHDTRIARLKELLPEAIKVYETAGARP